MSDRPEYVRCIIRELYAVEMQSWCGNTVHMYDNPFGSIDTAALNGLAMNRLVACPECVAAIYKALLNGSDAAIDEAMKNG